MKKTLSNSAIALSLVLPQVGTNLLRKTNLIREPSGNRRDVSRVEKSSHDGDPDIDFMNRMKQGFQKGPDPDDRDIIDFSEFIDRHGLQL